MGGGGAFVSGFLSPQPPPGATLSILVGGGGLFNQAIAQLGGQPQTSIYGGCSGTGAGASAVGLAGAAVPLTGRPAVKTAELAVMRELGEAVLLEMFWPAVTAAVPPVGTNRIGVVPMATADVCMKPRTATDEDTRADFVSRTVVLLTTRSIFVPEGIPNPVTSMPLAR